MLEKLVPGALGLWVLLGQPCQGGEAQKISSETATFQGTSHPSLHGQGQGGPQLSGSQETYSFLG